MGEEKTGKGFSRRRVGREKKKRREGRGIGKRKGEKDKLEAWVIV